MSRLMEVSRKIVHLLVTYIMVQLRLVVLDVIILL